MENETDKKPRILCFHGFRTSAAILKKLVDRWPETILEKLDLVFLDAPFPARGNSDVEGIFDPPYYEWFQANEDFTEYTNSYHESCDQDTALLGFPHILTPIPVDKREILYETLFQFSRILQSTQILKNA